MSSTPPVRLRTLLILLITLGLLPIAVIGAWGIRTASVQQQQALERSMVNLSRALSSAVESELEGNISALRTLSYNPALIRGDVASFYSVAQESVRARPDWTAVILTDHQGKLLFKTVAPLGTSQARVIDEASLTKAIATREPTVGIIANGQFAPPAFAVRVPVMVNGELAYVVSAAIKPDRMLGILQRQQVDPSWVVSVHDASGLRVARSRDHAKTIATQMTPSLAQLVERGGAEGAGVTRTLEGIESITAFTRSDRHNWVVVVGAPMEQFQQVLRNSYAVYLLAIVLSLGACVGLAALISRRIVRAIAQLQEQAARLGRGEPVELVSNPFYEVQQMGLALRAASQQRVAIEQEREQALARAQESGQAKDQFMAVLGHELRNPLAPIASALELMEAREQNIYVRERQIMRRQVQHMMRLVDDLLDVSRITQGKLTIQKAPVNLAAVARQAMEAVQPAVNARERDVTITLAETVWVNGDEARLVQVVTNLLRNALHFDQRGRIALHLEHDGSLARISVRDQGIGMAPECAARVFAPFYQAPQSADRPSGGLGLGLAIVRSIVELHDGQVRAHSDGPGRGSTFEVTLPTMAAPSQQDAPPILPASSRPLRVLLVDDNVDAAHTVAQLLIHHGHEVRTCHDARQALSAFADFEADAAILDIGLPQMDGYALAGALRAAYPQWTGRLIALTGYGQASDRQRAADAGFHRHLTKPVALRDLMEALTGEAAP